VEHAILVAKLVTEIQVSHVSPANLPTTEPKVEIPVLVIMVITIMGLIYVQHAIELVAHVAARELVSV